MYANLDTFGSYRSFEKVPTVLRAGTTFGDKKTTHQGREADGGGA